MRLFNLSCLLLLVIGCAYPVFQWQWGNVFRDLGIELPTLTACLLSPWVPYCIFGSLILRLWILVNFKEHIPIRNESIVVLISFTLFFIMSLIGFTLPFYKIIEAIGKQT